MFGFFRKKVNEESIKAFESAIKAIEVYIALSDWKKAKQASKEIIQKEKKALENYIQNTKDNQRTVNKVKKEFEEKENKVEKLLVKIDLLEKNYEENIKKERFKVRFETIKKEINNLIWQTRATEAMSILTSFYEQNKDEIIVINFYKKQKAIIQKVIDKKILKLEDRIKANAELEAMSLIWEKIDEKDIPKEEEKGFFWKIMEKLHFQSNLRKRIEEKKLLDEVNILIEEDSKVKKELAAKKLEKIHSWLVKELVYENMIWYELYWKILWADKISWDTFGIEENNENYLMFLWDATGHGVKAGFIISVFNKLFKTLKDKKITDIYFEINNQLKQTLESKNFITWALFEINKQNLSINYAWMWHEPIFIYRKKTGKVEKKVLGWLAAWIRIIKDISQIKIKNIDLEDWDILMIFSDWIVESKWLNWELYSIPRLERTFDIISRNETNLRKIYDLIIDDLKLFRWGTKFDDDASILMLKRSSERDLVKKWDEILEEIREKEHLKKEELKRLEWETRKNLNKKLEAIRKEKETKRVITILEDLYYSGEILQLKQEAIRYIKEWFIDKKINFFLKKAIENENKYKIEQKNQKMQNKFSVLKWLYDKWDYDTVIKEIEYIILKDWNF